MKKLMKLAATTAQEIGRFPIALDSTNHSSSADKTYNLSLLWNRISLVACFLIVLPDI